MLLNRWLRRSVKLGEPLAPAKALDRQTRACAVEPQLPEHPPGSGLRLRVRAGLLAWLLSPPLAFGGSRGVTESQATRALELADSDLAVTLPNVERVESEAVAGWEQGRTRGQGIESRAIYVLTSSGVLLTLLLGSAGLMLGTDGRLQGAARVMTIIGFCLAVAFLAASLAYALVALTWSFSRISPDITPAVIKRSGLPTNKLAACVRLA